MDSQVGLGPIWHCLVSLGALHALSCPIVGSLLDQREPRPRPPPYIRNPYQQLQTKAQQSCCSLTEQKGERTSGHSKEEENIRDEDEQCVHGRVQEKAIYQRTWRGPQRAEG
ncbi:hypothetical protein CJ030_MR3G024375 [Morella rubra]|uniref:Uncharacterized protein n=1 Tax=Morella rubra TaxID=262757 RepID=A0A6A1WE58_9ROSI|nr:hypothetical protein CJ030_MR3G024375 [Morella rubra]